MMTKLWAQEPVVLSLAGSAAVWLAVFAVLAAFGHPLSSTQQTALLGLLAAIGGVVGRSQVTPVANSGGAGVGSVSVSGLGKSLILAAILLGSMATFPACSSNPPPNLSPAAQRAYHADQVITRIGEFQQAVIDLTGQNKVKTEDARVIVTWTVASIKALQTAPQGWVQVASSGWPAVRAVVVKYPAVAPYADLVDGFLTAGVQ